MNQIRLIHSDFKSLDKKEFIASDQYSDPLDCPIARALRRKFPDSRISVGDSYFRINGAVHAYMKGGFREVDRCRASLNKGAVYAIIKVKS